MDCPRFAEEISARLDGELDAAGRAALESHLAGCPDCRRLAADLERAVKRVRALPAAALPRDFSRLDEPRLRAAPWQPIFVPGAAFFRYAAAAAAALIVVAVLCLLPEEGSRPARHSPPPPATAAPTPAATAALQPETPLSPRPACSPRPALAAPETGRPPAASPSPADLATAAPLPPALGLPGTPAPGVGELRFVLQATGPAPYRSPTANDQDRAITRHQPEPPPLPGLRAGYGQSPQPSPAVMPDSDRREYYPRQDLRPGGGQGEIAGAAPGAPETASQVEEAEERALEPAEPAVRLVLFCRDRQAARGLLAGLPAPATAPAASAAAYAAAARQVASGESATQAASPGEERHLLLLTRTEYDRFLAVAGASAQITGIGEFRGARQRQSRELARRQRAPSPDVRDGDASGQGAGSLAQAAGTAGSAPTPTQTTLGGRQALPAANGEAPGAERILVLVVLVDG